MTILYYVFIAICGGVAFFLIFPFVSLLFSLFRREKIKVAADIPKFRNHDFGIVITAYRNVEITRPLVDSLVYKQAYPHFHVYLVADECDVSTFDLRHEKLTLIHPDPPLRLKAKSIILGMQSFVRPHDYVVVFDADNLAHPDFLVEINRYINNGHRVVQGQRTAKNLDSVYACADATGEFYKNYVERYLPYLLGSSAVISGSGMAVETTLYTDYLNSPEIQRGKQLWKKMLQEDKILQNHLLNKDEKISYAKGALVYDEKVSSARQVETQRSRWLFSYFQNLPNSTSLFLKGLSGLSWNQLYFGLITMSPPLFISLFSAVALALIGWWIEPVVSLGLILALLVFSGNLLLTLALSAVPAPIWKALWGLPFFVLKQVTALFRMGNPNKNFKHSEHSKNYTIDEVLQQGTADLSRKGKS